LSVSPARLTSVWYDNTAMSAERVACMTAINLANIHGKFLFLCSCAMMFVLLYSIKGKMFNMWEDLTFTNNMQHTECPLLTLNSTVSYKYIVRPEEREFPLAFSLIVYTDADRVLRLFRAIYRPHNYYCIHIDRKSKPEFVNVTERLKQC
uniref:Protein xylosyltransferase n=1 Tax=Echinostoma caproni TaxID=27848 RepID=A0A183A3A7_9TREM